MSPFHITLLSVGDKLRLLNLPSTIAASPIYCQELNFRDLTLMLAMNIASTQTIILFAFPFELNVPCVWILSQWSLY